MARGEGRFARCHEKEAAGAVGVLCHAWLEAGLAEERGLLVTCDAENRNLVTVDFREQSVRWRELRWHDLREARLRNVEHRGELGVPRERVQVEEKGAACVGHVRDVMRATGEIPDDPAV